VFLPAAEAATIPAPGEDAGEAPRVKRRILVMDDEPLIRDVVSDLLSDLGYEVRVAKDGREALEIYELEARTRGPFDAVLMDLTVPGGMGGAEAVGLLREIDPQVRAIVSSGYSQDPIMANFEDHGFCEVVAKPYTVSLLARVLEKVSVVSVEGAVTPSSRPRTESSTRSASPSSRPASRPRPTATRALSPPHAPRPPIARP